MEMVDYKARAYLPTAASVPVCLDVNDNIHLGRPTDCYLQCIRFCHFFLACVSAPSTYIC